MNPRVSLLDDHGAGWSDLNRAISRATSFAEDSYLQSPTYYLLTGRRGAWIYSADQSALVSCVHPHCPNRLLVFPELSPDGSFELTLHFLETMSGSEFSLQLARFQVDQLHSLESAIRAKLDASMSVTVADELSMDWRFPLRIIDTQLVATVAGREFAKIRNKLRKVAPNVTVTPIQTISSLPALQSVLHIWGDAMRAQFGEDDGLTDFYDSLIVQLRTHPDRFGGLIFYYLDEPSGFTVWDMLTNGVANLFANIANNSRSGMSDFQLVESCRHLHNSGIQRLNLGGSERQGLDRFKVKFQPITTVELLSALVEPIRV